MNITRKTAVSKKDKLMDTHRQAATILDLLFYQPIRVGPDYLINGAAHKNQVVLGILMELILVCTAIDLFPVLTGCLKIT